MEDNKNVPPTENDNSQNQGRFGNFNTSNNPQEELDTPMTILSACIPLAGAIMFFMYKDSAPAKSKKACYAALIGFGIYIVINIIFGIIAAMGN